MKTYKTVKDSAIVDIFEKKSQFIAHVAPVESQEDALEFINSVKKEHYKARHNVFAYRVGVDSIIEKQTDDGEPSGTAGMPIFDLLRSLELTNIVIVVTRYFGGTLLGTGGLVRAYGRSAKDGIEKAGILEKRPYQEFCIAADYSLLGKLQYEILGKQFFIDEIGYTDRVELTVLVPLDQCDFFLTFIEDISSAQAEVIKGNVVYINWLNGERVI